MSLSREICDEIDGDHPRDGQLSDWSRQAEALEWKLEQAVICLQTIFDADGMTNLLLAVASARAMIGVGVRKQLEKTT